MDLNNGLSTSMDDAVSPDNMDVLLQRSTKRRGGTFLDDVPLFSTFGPTGPKDNGEPSKLTSHTSRSSDEDWDSLTELSMTSPHSDSFLKPLGPMQFIKRKSLLQKDERTPLQRFRLIANQVKNNLKWAKALDENKQEDEKSFVVEDQDGKEQKLTFDVNAFKANVQTINVLPPSAKVILRQNPWERTPEDLLYVIPFISKLKCFEKYSLAIKQELACVLHYESFEDGRIIVKQGHPGLSFYFILSGAVTAEVTEVDKRTGEQHAQYAGELPAGSSFGELALLHGSKRTATIICKGDTEFLRLDKSDFDMVLRRSYQLEWETRMIALRSLAAFGDWSEEELRATTDRANQVQYPPNTVILGDVTQQPDNIYFIKSGECKIVRNVTLVQTQLPFGRVKYSLPPISADNGVGDSFKLERFQKLIQKHLHVATIKRGDFFGVGEDLRKTYIISIDKVECILVSQVAFLRHERGKCLEPMKQKALEFFPSTETAFQSFLDSKRWRAYKRGLVKELVAKRHIPNSTTIADVPLVTRRDNQIL